MKKIKNIIILFLLVMILTPFKVGAIQTETTGTIKILWGDYEDRMKERPKEFEVELLDLVTDETYTVKVEEKNATITQKDGQTTIWEVPVTLPMFDKWEASYQYTKTNLELPGYIFGIDGVGGRISEDGGKITLVFFKDINKTIKYHFKLNEDYGRDFSTGSYLGDLWLKAKNSIETYQVQCDSMTFKNGECTGEVYIHAYKADENKRPIWDDPIEYEVQMANTDPLFTHTIDLDMENNKLDVELKYDVETIDDIDIKVNFLNGHEYPVKLNLMNQSKKLERTLTSDKDVVVKKLFKNMPIKKEIEYSLEVEEKENYTYEIAGNQIDGFEVNVEYHEPIINPETSDNLPVWIIVGLISLISLITITKTHKALEK